jgi:hypothetical protein
MRHPLSIAVIAVLATLLIGAAVKVLAAGAKTSVVRTQFYYAAPTSGIAVPPGMKFPRELLPE